MLGLFDSGSGGLNTVRLVKERYPEIDLVYLIDRENAPYGSKTEKEITEITKKNIERLADMGAERVLIACCTASTVYDRLPVWHREMSLPIIEETARAASNMTGNGRIAVLATERTVSSHAFALALGDCSVLELAAPHLATLIDRGVSDASDPLEKRRATEGLLYGIPCGTDTLILGCTHFSSLQKTIAKEAKGRGIRNIVDSAEIAAITLNKAFMQTKIYK